MQTALIAVLLFAAASCGTWFQMNLQYIDERWKEREILLIMLTSLPIAFAYYYAWSFAVAAFDKLWTARFVGFAASTLVFAPLTWYFLNESCFTPKVMMCTVLALLILVIQVFLP